MQLLCKKLSYMAFELPLTDKNILYWIFHLSIFMNR
jgi:hypothetical protein